MYSLIFNIKFCWSMDFLPQVSDNRSCTACHNALNELLDELENPELKVLMISNSLSSISFYILLSTIGSFPLCSTAQGSESSS